VYIAKKQVARAAFGHGQGRRNVSMARGAGAEKVEGNANL